MCNYANENRIMDKFHNAKELVEKILKKYNINSQTYTLFESWEKVVGKLSNKIKLKGYKNNTIFVTTDSSIYAQELKLRKKEIIEEIRKNIPDIDIKDIKVSNK